LFCQETLIKTFLPRKQPSIKQGLPVEKNAFFTAVFIAVLLLSAVAGTQLVMLGAAQPEMTWTSPPIISIHSPANDTYINARNVLLNLTVTKPARWLSSMGVPGWNVQELQTIRYQIDGMFYETVGVGSDLSSPFNYIVNLTNVTDGEHILVVYAYASGFEYEQWYEVPRSFVVYSSSSVTFTLDTTSPSVSVLSLENMTYYRSDVALNFTVNESVSHVTYSVDGQDNVTVAGNTTLTGLSPGVHNVTVYATDVVGQIGASETIAFTVAEEPEPFPTAQVVASVAILAVVGGGLLVYFKKRKH
jgi:hypothetical protein